MTDDEERHSRFATELADIEATRRQRLVALWDQYVTAVGAVEAEREKEQAAALARRDTPA